VTASIGAPQRRSAWGHVRFWARRAIMLEIGVWQSLYRFTFRRQLVPPGATAFGYHRPVLSVLTVFIVLSAIEIPIIDLVVHRWTAVRIPLLVLGIWGLTFMVGTALGYLTRPHAVGPAGIRIRQGTEIDIPIAWEDIASIARVPFTVEPKTPRIAREGEAVQLALRIANETNIDIELERPVTVKLPQGTESVTMIRIHVDDPRAFLDTARRHLSATY
jgi:hypothetical protein